MASEFDIKIFDSTIVNDALLFLILFIKQELSYRKQIARQLHKH